MQTVPSRHAAPSLGVRAGSRVYSPSYICRPQTELGAHSDPCSHSWSSGKKTDKGRVGSPLLTIVHCDSGDGYYSSHVLINQHFNHGGAENKACVYYSRCDLGLRCVMTFTGWSAFGRALAAAAADTRGGGWCWDQLRGKLMTLLGLLEFYMQSTSLPDTPCASFAWQAHRNKPPPCRFSAASGTAKTEPPRSNTRL